MSDVVYEVPADTARGAVRAMDAAEMAALDARVHSVAEVLVVASLLAKVPKFPLDMIDNVLMLADYFVTFEATTRELRRGRSDMDEVYCELRLPRADELGLPLGVTLARCVDLVAECSSHDQGWASQDNEHDGTYNASYTWSEIALIKPEQEQDEAQPAARHAVATNVRVQRQFRHHLKRFADPQGLAQEIALGDTVQLYLRAIYPGWANTANFARLRARFQVDVREDAQLLTWQQLAKLEGELTLPPRASTMAIASDAVNKCCVH